jgi:beta-mannosidase
MTCGPYRPITFTAYNARIKEANVSALAKILDDGTFTASLKVNITLDGSWDTSALVVTMVDQQGRIVKTERLEIAAWDGAPGLGAAPNGSLAWNNLQSEGVELWWPVNYGNQTMYTVEVSLVGPVSISPCAIE